jgi:hypothetical protein
MLLRSALACDRRTLYRRTADALHQRVAHWVWKPGDRLPPESQLCEEHGVSGITTCRRWPRWSSMACWQASRQGRLRAWPTCQRPEATPDSCPSTRTWQLRGWRRRAPMPSLVEARAEPAVATKLELTQGWACTCSAACASPDDRAAALQTTCPSLPFPGFDTCGFLPAVAVRGLRVGVRVAPPPPPPSAVPAGSRSWRRHSWTCRRRSLALRVERLTTGSNRRRIELVDSVIRGDTLVLPLSAAGQSR